MPRAVSFLHNIRISCSSFHLLMIFYNYFRFPFALMILLPYIYKLVQTRMGRFHYRTGGGKGRVCYLQARGFMYLEKTI
jgi:hypothetical protein